MTQPLRIVDTGLNSARWNVAMTAALTELHAKSESADTVRFHRYRPCVLLGRSQDAAAAIDVAYCAGHDIEVVHRVTGGGAVFLSPRMFAWDVVLDRGTCGGDLGSVTEAICAGVAAGLARLGVAARFRAPNDIEIGGRKVSGSSGYSEGRSIVLQGTVLIEDEVGTMARALGLSEETLRRGMTCLHEAAGAVIPMASVMTSISAALCEALGKSGSAQSLHHAEQARCEQLFLSPRDDELPRLAGAA